MLIASTSPTPLVPLGPGDLLVLVTSFAFVPGIGFYLKRFAIWRSALMLAAGIGCTVAFRPAQKQPPP